MDPETVFLNFQGAQESIPRNQFRQPMDPETVSLNFQGAQESVPRNQFHQPMDPGGPVRQILFLLSS